MDAAIQVRVEGAIGVIVLDRADKMNALTTQMLSALEHACQQLEDAEDVRVVLIESSQTRAFCAGADIVMGSQQGPQGKWARWSRAGDRKSTRLNSSHIPLSRMPSSA